jgi:hypothetical protein
VGIEPEVEVQADPSEFGEEQDPVVDAALKRLRKASKSKRQPGRRG